MIYTVTFLFLIFFAVWIKSLDIESSWQRAGFVNFSLGFVLLSAYMSAQILKTVRLPLISAYIFAGIIAGPYIGGFLTHDMVQRLRLIDDLALSFIALTAGGALRIQFLKKRGRAIAVNIVLQTLMISGLVFVFVFLTSRYFTLTCNLATIQVIALAILLGVLAVARSPSSTIAVISECRASGTFTETVLGVTVTVDVLIIILFTFAMTVAKIVLSCSAIAGHHAFLALFFEIIASIFLGVALGKGVSAYIDRVGYDLPLFLLFMAIGVTKTSLWLNSFMAGHFNIYFNLEPLLICMSAGFTVQNFSRSGSDFMESLERFALPVYVLFFSMAGASLNLKALYMCWPFAVCLTLIRVMGIFGATWFAGKINNDPKPHYRNAWMAYITQAGVAIGLAQLAQRQFPEIGVYLNTIVLAVIAVNQIAGPIAFKAALNLVGEARRR